MYVKINEAMNFHSGLLVLAWTLGNFSHTVHLDIGTVQVEGGL